MRLDFERVAVGLAYQHSARVDNTGDVTMVFGCPPQDDVVGRFGAEQCHRLRDGNQADEHQRLELGVVGIGAHRGLVAPRGELHDGKTHDEG